MVSTQLEMLFEEGVTALSVLNKLGSDKESVISDFLIVNDEIDRVFELEVDLFWTNASFDYLHDSSRNIGVNLFGLRLCVLDLAGSLLFSFEHEDDWKIACTRCSVLAFLFSHIERARSPTTNARNVG